MAGLFFTPVSTDGIRQIMEGANAPWAYYIMRPEFEMAGEQAQRREGNFRYGNFMPMAHSREMGLWTNYDRSAMKPRPEESTEGDKDSSSGGR